MASTIVIWSVSVIPGLPPAILRPRSTDTVVKIQADPDSPHQRAIDDFNASALVTLPKSHLPLEKLRIFVIIPQKKRKINPILLNVLLISVGVHAIALFILVGLRFINTSYPMRLSLEPSPVVEEQPPPEVKIENTTTCSKAMKVFA